MRNFDEIRVGRNSVVAAVFTTVAIVGLARTAVGVTPPPHSLGAVASVLSGGGGAPTAPPLADAAQAPLLVTTPEPLPGTGSYQVGDRVPEIDGVDFASNGETLLMVLRNSCADCTASMEFYKRLAGGSRRARLVVLSTDPADTIRSYLDQHGFDPDQVLSTAGLSRISSTPALLFVDRDRTITHLWTGSVNRPSQQRDVINALR
jgi:hypothetical protein